MSLLSRSTARPLVNQLRNNYLRAHFATNSESYTQKQDKTGRPVSPHVTIYKFPPSALSSIANRVTGVALSVGNLFYLISIK